MLRTGREGRVCLGPGVRAEEGADDSGREIFLFENVLKLIVVMDTQLCKYIKSQ